jgi:phosphoglycerol transferase MdoB-like AlkP superfamily enzyme
MLPVPTIASYLRGLGYRTICIHPYPATFYGRDRVFPALGFDEFVDLRSFGDAMRFGPYVSDASVADKIIGAVGDGGRPAFVFAITMENHGPLHLESVAAGEANEYFREAPAGASPIARDLAVYLRHLKNADRMLGRLISWMAGRRRPGVLCFYGDHVPIMPEAWETAGDSDGATDYVLWRTGPTAGGWRGDISVERLGVMLLESAGVLAAALPAPVGPPGDSPYDPAERPREPSLTK